MKKTTTNNNSIKYTKAFINLLKDLSMVNDSVIIEKSEDEKNIIVKRKSPAGTIAYILVCPIENFEFKGKEIGIYKFGSEFYQLLNEFKSPIIEQIIGDGHEKLILSEGDERINYLLSNTESIIRGPNKVNFSEPDVSVEFSEDELKKIEKLCGLIGAEKVQVSFKKDKVIFKLYNSGHENSYEKSLTIKENKSDEEFSLKISNEVFLMMPKANYLMEAKKEGVIRFTLKPKEADSTFNPKLEIFTAELEEND